MKIPTYKETVEALKNMGVIIKQPPEASPEEIEIRLKSCEECFDDGKKTLTEDRKCSAMKCQSCNIDDIVKLKNRTCPWGRWPKGNVQ